MANFIHAIQTEPKEIGPVTACNIVTAVFSLLCMNTVYQTSGLTNAESPALLLHHVG